MANKNRLLFLLKYLTEQTDDNRCVTASELQRVMNRADCSATVRTIRDDIATLCAAGYDIIMDEKPGLPTTYHMGARLFELPELQILIDAVSSSRFISVEKSRQLIDKLITLSGVSEAPTLRANHLVAQKVKADNQSLYYILSLIDQAIAGGRKISFQYSVYGPDLKKHLKHDGEPYFVSPYARVWSDDRYYLLGWSDKHGTVAAFRIDHMLMPNLLTDAAHPIPPDFDVSAYSSSIIRMFDGEQQLVTLRCDNNLITKLVDRFGRENVRVLQAGPSSLLAEVPVAVSVTFYGWLLQYAGHMSVVAPEAVRQGYRSILRQALEGCTGK